MPKRIPQSKLIERAGIALIDQRVTEMEFVWHERRNDFGIDGEIEFRDPRTEAALNSVAFVQSKASNRSFPGETPQRFHYVCREEDIAYWLGGNAPVILVCSHPKTREAWWASVKDWFSTPERIASRRIEFDKRTQRFDSEAATQLLSLAAPTASGLYFGPIPGPERLTTNLLPLVSLPKTIHWAPSTASGAREVRQQLVDAGKPAMDWIRRDGRIYSFRDLSRPPLQCVCDGPVGSIPTKSWLESEDPGERRKLVELLKHTLQEQCFNELSWHPVRRFFYFRATRDLRPRRIDSGRSRQGVTVFREYTSGAEQAHTVYFRHFAADLRLVRFDGQWYCEILPTYHYTSDGRTDSRLEADALSGIKALEKNEAVRRHVQLWAHYLRTRTGKASGAELRFGDLVDLDVEVVAATAAATAAAHSEAA